MATSKTSVVSQVPTYIVGVFVDNDPVAVPIPVITEAVIIRSYVEVVTPEPEAFPASAGQHPHVTRTKAAVVRSVLPRMLKVIVVLFPAVVVSDPPAIVVNVRPVRMSFAIAIDVLVPITPVVATVITVMVVVPVAPVVLPITVRPAMRNVFMVVPVAVVVTIMIAIVVLRYPVNGKEEIRNQNCKEFLQSPILPVGFPRLLVNSAATISQAHKLARLPEGGSSTGRAREQLALSN